MSSLTFRPHSRPNLCVRSSLWEWHSDTFWVGLLFDARQAARYLDEEKGEFCEGGGTVSRGDDELWSKLLCLYDWPPHLADRLATLLSRALQCKDMSKKPNGVLLCCHLQFLLPRRINLHRIRVTLLNLRARWRRAIRQKLRHLLRQDSLRLTLEKTHALYRLSARSLFSSTA